MSKVLTLSTLVVIAAFVVAIFAVDCENMTCRLDHNDCCPCYKCLQTGGEPQCVIATPNGASYGQCNPPLFCENFVKGWNPQKPNQCMKYSSPVSWCIDKACAGPGYSHVACEAQGGSSPLSECDPSCVNPSACVQGTSASASQNASLVCLVNQLSSDAQNCGPIPCKGILAGFDPDKKTCSAYTQSTSSGACTLDAQGRSVCSTDVSQCSKYVSTEALISCGSAECARPDGCPVGGNASTATLESTCFVDQESPNCSSRSCSDYIKGWDGLSCMRYAEEKPPRRCNHLGTCEGEVAPEGCKKSEKGTVLARCGSTGCQMPNGCPKHALVSDRPFNLICLVGHPSRQCTPIECENYFAGVTDQTKCARYASKIDGFCDSTATCSTDVSYCNSTATVVLAQCPEAACTSEQSCPKNAPIPADWKPESFCLKNQVSKTCRTLPCDSVLAGWSTDGATCNRFDSTSGFCLSDSTCANFPTGPSETDSLARKNLCQSVNAKKVVKAIACGSPQCARRDVCSPGAIFSGSFTVDAFCYTSASSGGNCPSGQHCNAEGRCADAESSIGNDPAVKGVLVGVGIIGGILLLIGAVVGVRRYLKYRRLQHLREGGYDDGESRPLLERGGKIQTFADLFAHSSIKLIDPSDIEMLHSIGTGASGIVYAGRWKSKNNMPVAVKAIALISAPPKGINIDEIQSLLAPTISEFVIEIKIMASLAHPNLMPLLGVIAQSHSECRLVTEYMPRGSLSAILPHLDRKYLFPMTKSIAMGMHYLVSRSTPILHRDLKLENVLVADDYTVKISDFGLSKVASPTMTQQAVGTPHYMAPECIEHGLFSEKSDVYAFGILVWEFYTQRRCYEGMNPMQIMYKVVHSGLTPPVSPTWPPQLVQLINDCTEFEPADRPTFKAIIDRMKDWDESIMLVRPIAIPTVTSAVSSPASPGGRAARPPRRSPGDMGGSPM